MFFEKLDKDKILQYLQFKNQSASNIDESKINLIKTSEARNNLDNPSDFRRKLKISN